MSVLPDLKRDCYKQPTDETAAKRQLIEEIEVLWNKPLLYFTCRISSMASRSLKETA